jgi:hypothetical protein
LLADLVRRTVVIAVMIVVVPIALGMPTVPVLVPPLVKVRKAILARFVQFMASVVRLLTLTPMMLDGFMKAMIGPGDAFLAIVVIGAQTRCAGEEQKASQRGASQHYFPDSKNSRLKFGLHQVLSSI